jgi:hypothetical protein
VAKREIPETDPAKLRKQFPGNSYAHRDAEPTSDQPTKKLRKVATAKVKRQGLLRKFTRYIVEDTIESAREKTLSDIVIPGVKTLIFDTATEILDLMLFGGSGHLSSKNRNRRERASYSSYYDDKNRGGRRNESYRNLGNDPDDIILDTRREAQDVLEELDHLIHQYGQASIADFYDIVGVTSTFTDNKYGWTSIRNAGIKPVREGFLIILPRTQVLDD